MNRRGFIAKLAGLVGAAAIATKSASAPADRSYKGISYDDLEREYRKCLEVNPEGPRYFIAPMDFKSSRSPIVFRGTVSPQEWLNDLHE